jgi:U3 small nucleolar ribonucleoprotein component
MQLSSDQQEVLLDIVHKRHIEQRRNEIAENARLSIQEFQAGLYKPMTADEAIAELRANFEEDYFRASMRWALTHPTTTRIGENCRGL